jgi:hypothetical protein
VERRRLAGMLGVAPRFDKLSVTLIQEASQ